MHEAISLGWDNLVGRTDGPMDFRLFVQPAMAIFLAIRIGLTDARQGEPPFLWTIVWNSALRVQRLRQGWQDVRNVFIFALILDVIYQLLMHSSIYVVELIVAATILAIVPYALVRGLVTRLVRMFVAVDLPDDVKR